MNICVVGLGNIGYNLFSYLNQKFPGEVSGVDVNERLVKELRRKGLKVTADYRDLTDIDVWLMAPSTGDRGQNIFAALEQMKIRPGSLLSIESTLPPGTMKRIRCFLEEKGFTVGIDIYVIHVPHRVMFGVDKTVCDTPRVMGAFTQACLDQGRRFYRSLVPQLIEVADVQAAELAKVVENVKRYVDIAFAQEIYSYCVAQRLDYDELRRAVNSKNNVELLETDWGIGGECLPKDLAFLQTVCQSPLLQGAEQADRDYRERIVKQIGNGKRVLVRGVSYKTGVKDLAHSRGVDLVRALEAAGNIVQVEDSLFTSKELSEAGFNRLPECAGLQEARAKAPAANWLILERQKALNLTIMNQENQIKK